MTQPVWISVTNGGCFKTWTPTIDRIDDLLVRVGGLGFLRDYKQDLHTILNHVDSAIGADTEWLSSLECQCLWHIGKACHSRRAVGARVKMLEEFVVLSEVRSKFNENFAV